MSSVNIAYQLQGVTSTNTSTSVTLGSNYTTIMECIDTTNYVISVNAIKILEGSTDITKNSRVTISQVEGYTKYQITINSIIDNLTISVSAIENRCLLSTFINNASLEISSKKIFYGDTVTFKLSTKPPYAFYSNCVKIKTGSNVITDYTSTPTTISGQFIARGHIEISVCGLKYASYTDLNYSSDPSAQLKTYVAYAASKSHTQSDSSNSIKGTKQKLGTPTNITIKQNLILWDKVPNADKYLIQYDDTQSTTAYSVPYVNLGFLTTGAHTIKIQAQASNGLYYDSDAYTFTVSINSTSTYTSIPQNVTMNDNILYWDEVTDSEFYIIYNYGIPYAISYNRAYSVYRESAGTRYNFQVSACTQGKLDSSLSYPAYEYVAQSGYIMAPTNLQLVNNVLTWDAPDYAEEYTVACGANSIITSDLTCNLKDVFMLSGDMNYKVFVKAVPFGKYGTSKASSVLLWQTHELNAPQITYDVSSTTISWNTVTNATKYIVCIQGQNDIECTTNSLNIHDYINFDSSLSPVAIQVYAKSTNNGYLNSKYSNTLIVSGIGG